MLLQGVGLEEREARVLVLSLVVELHALLEARARLHGDGVVLSGRAMRNAGGQECYEDGSGDSARLHFLTRRSEARGRKGACPRVRIRTDCRERYPCLRASVESSAEREAEGPRRPEEAAQRGSEAGAAGGRPRRAARARPPESGAKASSGRPAPAVRAGARAPSRPWARRGRHGGRRSGGRLDLGRRGRDLRGRQRRADRLRRGRRLGRVVGHRELRDEPDAGGDGETGDDEDERLARLLRDDVVIVVRALERIAGERDGRGPLGLRAPRAHGRSRGGRLGVDLGDCGDRAGRALHQLRLHRRQGRARAGGAGAGFAAIGG